MIAVFSDVAKVPDVKAAKETGAVLDPEKREIVYPDRSLIKGAVFDSDQVTVMALPAGNVVPAVGDIIFTSA